MYNCVNEILASFVGSLLLWKYKKVWKEKTKILLTHLYKKIQLQKIQFLNKPLYESEINKYNVEQALRLIIIYERNKAANSVDDDPGFIAQCLSVNLTWNVQQFFELLIINSALKNKGWRNSTIFG